MHVAINGKIKALRRSCNRLPAAILPDSDLVFADNSLLRSRQQFFHALLDAIGTAFWRPVMENRKEVCAAMRWRQALPLFGRPEILSERQLHDWRKLALSFHGLHQAL